MDKFRVIVWCKSCRGDDEGCFGGSDEVIGAAFKSWEDAEKAGAHYCSDLPYRYRVEQEDPICETSGEAHQFAFVAQSFLQR